MKFLRNKTFLEGFCRQHEIWHSRRGKLSFCFYTNLSEAIPWRIILKMLQFCLVTAEKLPAILFRKIFSTTNTHTIFVSTLSLWSKERFSINLVDKIVSWFLLDVKYCFPIQEQKSLPAWSRQFPFCVILDKNWLSFINEPCSAKGYFLKASFL